jgi:molybdopterin/thiamine biosynthesis adenylyltransferase
MMELLLGAEDFAAIKTQLTDGDTEKCAALLANQAIRSDGTLRLLVRQIYWPSLAEYTRKGKLEAELNPEFVAKITKIARREKSAIVFVHSHPGSEAPHFSVIDDEGEKHLSDFLARRHPEHAHVALVVSTGGARARRLGTSEEVRVISVGSRREIVFDPASGESSISERYDRQVRAFGAAGQRELQRLRVAIVGLGGTGSLVAQQLVHLGVRDFILIDPDVLEATNLNRVSAAFADDVGKAKVEIAARYIRCVAEDSNIQCVKGDIMQSKTARHLIDADIFFGCTDSHGSRAVLNQVAYQYMIPCIDMGVTLVAKMGSIAHVYGRIQLLSPGQGCLTCSNLLDPNEVRRDMMTAFERQADPYIQGDREQAPAVMSLNATVASLAVTMLIAIVTDVPVSARYLLYNALSSSLRPVRAAPDADCFVCSRAGAFARGDSWPLFARET